MSLGSPNPHSWFSRTLALARSYGIDLDSNFLNPMSKTQWKREVKSKVYSQHQQQLLIEATKKSSLHFMDLHSLSQDRPIAHRIWSDCGSDPATMHKTAYRAKMLTGSYLLQETLAKSSMINKDPKCELCHNESEDMVHFITTCPILQIARDSETKQLRCIIEQLGCQVPNNRADLTRTILNGFSQPDGSHIAAVESQSGSTNPSNNNGSRGSRTNECSGGLRNHGTNACTCSGGFSNHGTNLSKLCSTLCLKLHECRQTQLRKIHSLPTN